jgi:integrase
LHQREGGTDLELQAPIGQRLGGDLELRCIRPHVHRFDSNPSFGVRGVRGDRGETTAISNGWECARCTARGRVGSSIDSTPSRHLEHLRRPVGVVVVDNQHSARPDHPFSTSRPSRSQDVNPAKRRERDDQTPGHVLRRALSYAVDAKHVTWNPAAAARPPKLRHGVVGVDVVWRAEDVSKFLAHVTEDRLAPLWVLAATSGLRRAELLGARWMDVDLEGAALHVRSTRVAYGALVVTKEPKTVRSRRTIPLPQRTVEALRTWKVRQAKERLAAGSAYTDLGLVFANELGGYLSPSAVSKVFGRLVKGADLPRITLHQVRHSFATIALEQGVDVLYVSELLGHSSAAITQAVYQHSRPERVRDAVNTISKAIGG